MDERSVRERFVAGGQRERVAAHGPRESFGQRIEAGAPVVVVIVLAIAFWYAAAIGVNFHTAQALAGDNARFTDVVSGAMSLDRPLVPAPHQVAATLFSSVFGYPVTSPHSLVFHAAVTAVTAIAGFAIAFVAGLALAVGIVHQRTLDRALMPWIIASQTVPVLAIAPMIVVVLGNVGLTGLLPKALIAAWLSFFPITTAMVTGLRSPERMQRDLMRTYDASAWDIFTKLRWPASTSFLFSGLKIAATLALVGAIVAELPTGAQAGLGARLLAGSYYGQTLQIWAALVMAGTLTLLALAAANSAQALVVRRRGGRL
jgi:NitT/TauT family transport system permease protein